MVFSLLYYLIILFVFTNLRDSAENQEEDDGKNNKQEPKRANNYKFMVN